MTRLREEFDADAPMPGYASAPTECYMHPINCSVCGLTVYTDKISYESYVRTLEYDPANQFICDDCDQESIESHALSKSPGLPAG